MIERFSSEGIYKTYRKIIMMMAEQISIKHNYNGSFLKIAINSAAQLSPLQHESDQTEFLDLSPLCPILHL